VQEECRLVVEKRGNFWNNISSKELLKKKAQDYFDGSIRHKAEREKEKAKLLNFCSRGKNSI